MIHSLKILPKNFEAVISGEKTFELRKNDREFEKGDYLALNEWEQTSCVGGHYTGRSCMVYVDYILYGEAVIDVIGGLDEDYVIMAIKPCRIFKTQEGARECLCAPPEWSEVPVIENKRECENR